jgi:hypothetical protein
MNEVSWGVIKTLVQQKGLKLYHVVGNATTNSYDVYTTNHAHRWWCTVHGNEAQSSGEDFSSNFLGSSTEVENLGDFFAKSYSPVNERGAQLVEVSSKLSQKASFTVVTHDFSKPVTWWQNSVQVSNESLSDEGACVFASAHPMWLNVEHPKNFSEEVLNPGWAAGGYQSSDFWYYSWWQPDGTLKRRSYYYPVVEVQPGGTGSWVVANPTDASSPSYAYTIDYVNGKVRFNSVTNWPASTNVRASYFYVNETSAGSAFEIGPPSGKLWYLTRTEVQLSVGHSWRDTILFEGLQHGVVGTRAQYKCYAAMQSTATSTGMTMEGATGSQAAFAASAENGWSYGGLDGERGATKKIEIIPWAYNKPFSLKGSTQNRVRVSLVNGQKFTETDVANVTYYIDEFDE